MFLQITEGNNVFMRYRSLSAPLFIGVYFSTILGCASIISGGSQELTFDSEPKGASVFVDDRPVGKTPLTIELERDEHNSVTFEKEGYKTQRRALESELNGWFWGNIVTGGTFGSSTDSSTGAMYQYSPGQYYVSLIPIEGIGITSIPKQARAKEFIILSYTNLSDNIRLGEGEYLISLFKILEVKPEQQFSATTILRRFLITYKNDIPAFSDRVVDYFLGSASKTRIPTSQKSIGQP